MSGQFEEDKHPRDGGKFSSKPGSGGEKKEDNTKVKSMGDVDLKETSKPTNPHTQQIMDYFKKSPSGTFRPWDVEGDGQALEYAAIDLKQKGILGNKGNLGYGLKQKPKIPASVKPGGLSGNSRMTEAKRFERSQFSKIWSKVPSEKKIAMIKEYAHLIGVSPKQADNIKGFERDQIIKQFQSQGRMPSRKHYLNHVDSGDRKSVV